MIWRNQLIVAMPIASSGFLVTNPTPNVAMLTTAYEHGVSLHQNYGQSGHDPEIFHLTIILSGKPQHNSLHFLS